MGTVFAHAILNFSTSFRLLIFLLMASKSSWGAIKPEQDPVSRPTTKRFVVWKLFPMLAYTLQLPFAKKKTVSVLVSNLKRCHGRLRNPIPSFLDDGVTEERRFMGDKGIRRRSIFFIAVPKLLTNPSTSFFGSVSLVSVSSVFLQISNYALAFWYDVSQKLAFSSAVRPS